ncbi:ABC1 kinase family protein [Nocardia sp. alder85J]|uniref:ABC1 kinase family protein n=1 Tax=Nocardia sp. alder85J TaxID=2862949 RepID=UPI001CD3D1A3|nr:AarF/ABC1/UbiB kinase family protein [Nocardia sp. alder85J]MCX4094671.1 AarF/ABC1/UbiB kinase family protein [Nocardia sp. alder85J]
MADDKSARAGGRVIPLRRSGRPPTSRLVRDVKVASVPVAYSARRLAGVGRRLAGRSREEIGRDIRLRTAEHLVAVLGELKGCAAKVGQLAGIYCTALPFGWGSIVGAEFAELGAAMLARLQDSVPPMLPGLVHQVLAANLGPDWRDSFRDFEDRPAAAASLGQVHRAVWHDGRPVAVKIMYPGIRAAVHADLQRLRSLSGVLSAVLPGADVAAVIETVSTCVREELDYRQEAANQQACATAFAGDPDFVVPAVLTCTDDVIVGDWVDGTPITRWQATVDPGEYGRVGFLVLRFVTAAHRRTGLLYSDIHPGNLLVLPDGRLGVVDFGACGAFPPGFAQLLGDIADALLNEPPADLETVLLRHGFLAPAADFDADGLAAVAAPFLEVLGYDEFRLSPHWLREQVDAITAVRVSNVFRQMTLPPDLTVVARAVLTAMGTMCRLGATGPIRGEFLSWWPDLAQAVHRHEQRPRAAAEHADLVEG